MIKHTFILSSMRFQIFSESMSSSLVFESPHNSRITLRKSETLIKKRNSRNWQVACGMVSLCFLHKRNKTIWCEAASSCTQFFFYSGILNWQFSIFWLNQVTLVGMHPFPLVGLCWSHDDLNSKTAKPMMSSLLSGQDNNKIEMCSPINFIKKGCFSPIKDNESMATNL